MGNKTAAVRGFPKLSTSWRWEQMERSLSKPYETLSWNKRQSSSMCYFLSWKMGFVAIWMADWLSFTTNCMMSFRQRSYCPGLISLHSSNLIISHSISPFLKLNSLIIKVRLTNNDTKLNKYCLWTEEYRANQRYLPKKNGHEEHIVVWEMIFEWKPFK